MLPQVRPNGARLGTLPMRPQKDILLVNAPRGEITGFVLGAVTATQKRFEGLKRMREVAVFLSAQAGGTEGVAKLTAKFDGAGIDRIERLLLSIEGVYATLVAAAIGDDGIKPRETLALFEAVRRRLAANDGPREYLVRRLLEGALSRRAVQLDNVVGEKVVEHLRSLELPTEADRTEEVIFSVVEAWRAKGSIKQAVDLYAARGEIEPERLTDRVRADMIESLAQLGVNFTDAAGAFDVAGVNRGDFDEYFALAYRDARAARDGGTRDPIDAVRQKGAIADWNFEIEPFESTEEQGVIPENILAAGALDYIHVLGEKLGLFQLADMVVLKWGSGAIDLDPGETSAKLYRYWKLRTERTSPEDRAMLYKRVLDRGDANLLDGMVANEAFPGLWDNLMTAVTEYIARVEEKKTEESSISRQRIYQATKQLQYNLTNFTTGMAHMQVNDMYHHLQEARAILEDPQILDYFGSGRRKTIWTVIDRASKEWFGETPNIAALRDCAVEGNKVFQWIARFDAATVTDQEFLGFKDAAEAWILAQAAVGPSVAEPEDETGDAPDDAAKDDFDSDWDK